MHIVDPGYASILITVLFSLCRCVPRFPLVVVYRLPYLLRSKKFHTSFIYTVKPRLTATSLIRSPRYYRHFFLAACRKPPYIFLKKKNHVNTAKFFWLIGDRINGVPLYKNYIGQFLSACFFRYFHTIPEGFCACTKIIPDS